MPWIWHRTCRIRVTFRPHAGIPVNVYVPMIKNYFTAVWRCISRNKGFTAINILGLAIGMMACMLITQYVLHEFSYDDFHDKKNRIFRVQLDRYDKGELATRWASGCAGIGPDLKADFPEVA